MNSCLNESDGKPEITSSIIKLAEKSYSFDRIESLENEWFVEHPQLNKYIGILHNRKNSFKVNAITDGQLEQLIMELVESTEPNSDIAIKAAHSYINSPYPSCSFTWNKSDKIFYIFYIK